MGRKRKQQEKGKKMKLEREREREEKRRKTVTYRMEISFWTGQTSFDEADRRKHPKWNRILKRAGISTWAKRKKERMRFEKGEEEKEREKE